jgi:hypothetical protein
MQVSRDDGHVLCFDTRAGAGSPPLFTLAAHDEAATGVVWSPANSNLMFTSSVDKMVSFHAAMTVYLPASLLLHHPEFCSGIIFSRFSFIAESLLMTVFKQRVKRGSISDFMGVDS